MTGATRIGLFEAKLPASSPRPYPKHPAPCHRCTLTEHCLPALLNGRADHTRDQVLNSLVQQRNIHIIRREALFHQNDPFDELYIVQSGAVKTVLLDESGCEQISGFYFPGDMFGLDAISNNRHPTSCLALGNSTVCAIPFARLEQVSAIAPNIQHHLFRMMAREIERNQQMMMIMSRKSSEQKIAYLLIRFALHLKRQNQSTQQFTLPMSRRDMGNHLGMAVETVSRILSRFQRLKLLKVQGRTLSELNLAALQQHFESA